MRFLRKIRDYIAENKVVSDKDLQIHFDIEASALSGIIDLLIRKKEIERIDCNSCSSDCAKCPLSEDKEEYFRKL